MANLDFIKTVPELRNRADEYIGRLQNCSLKDPNLNEGQIKIILSSFSTLDENGDGRISKRELIRGYRVAGFNPTPEEAEAIIKEHDTNDDGYIDFEEYFNCMKPKMLKLDFEQERMKTAFRVLDLNNDGFLSIDELRQALNKNGKGFSDEEIQELLEIADTDGDGKIDYNEFVEGKLCKMVF